VQVTVSGLPVSSPDSVITIEVFAEQTIDFTRHDIGVWLWWVLFPLLLLTNLKKNDFVGGGALKTILIRLISGFILAAIIVGLITLWHVYRPQYFTTLRLEENTVVLKYHRFGPETVIQLKDVESLTVVRRRRSSTRVRIETTGGTFTSFAFARLDEDQLAVLDAVRHKIGATIQTPDQNH
jgi:hypothetical protein